MKYKIQQLKYSTDVLTYGEPHKIKTPSNNIAIIIHVYYLDVWQEIASYLTNLEIEYDLFVTLPEGVAENKIIEVFENTPDVNIYMTENRGRDVLPFLQVMSIIDIENYKYICKVHTKKTGESALGSVWRKLLYFDLLGSQQIVNEIISLFENGRDIGVITGKNTVLDSKRYTYGNTEKIDLLAKKAVVTYDEDYMFPAGTMFWTRPEIVAPLVKLLTNDQLDFEDETGQKDDTLAHAIERFFGIVCQVSEKKIIGSPALYSHLIDQTLEEVASLVLSQQYVGVDVFSMQNQKIQSSDEKIKELEKLIVSLQGQEIKTRDEKIIKLEELVASLQKHEIKTRDESILKLEKLVVSLRKQEIQARDDKVLELEELAVSLRLENIIAGKIVALKKKITKISRIITSVLVDVRNNPAAIKNAYCYLRRGGIKYFLIKFKEKHLDFVDESTKLIEVCPASYFTPFDKEKYTLKDITVDIIIPVYNGYEFLEKLFDSIEKNTESAYRLIVINDCSSDERVGSYLHERLKLHPDAVFIEHNENQGYLKSVNEAYTYVSDHFLVLNTDTEVPSFWMERLMYPIIYMDNVASSTPFTNSGEIASFPNFVMDNEIFDGMLVDDLDDVFKEINPQEFYAEVPTGVGFCMGVNFTLTKQIGMFVDDTFGKGYGEENDWCQRAIQKGYRNILVPNLFVYHKHGGSFAAEERLELIKENVNKVIERHPNYEKDVSAYIRKDPHNTLRCILVLLASNKNTAMHLIFDHDLGGGTNDYADDLIETYAQEEKNILRIKYNRHNNCFKLFHNYKQYEFSFKISSLTELQALLSNLNVNELFLNSLVSFKGSDEILSYIHAFVEEKKAKLIVPMHDFYALCPSYTLLNNNGAYCNIPLLSVCKTCMQQNMHEWRNYYDGEVDMPRWREVWFNLLKQSHEILCFSHSSKKILLKAYPDLTEEEITVRPHKAKSLQPIVLGKNTTDIVTIGVLGAINYAKGSHIIKHLVESIDRGLLKIKVVVIGEINETIKSENFSMTGRYQRTELPGIIKKYKVDIFLMPSIWPETFSYTTQEIMMMNMPLMVFNLGAPAERVAGYDNGYTIDEVSVNAVLKTVSTFQLKKGLAPAALSML